MSTLVEVKGLTKTYGATIAVDDISFDIQEGEIFGMVGPNGAGKTTTIEIIEGLRKADRGTVRVLGLDPVHQERQLRPLLGIQLQQANLPENIKVWEALDLYASFYTRTLDWQELLEGLGLTEKRNSTFRKLSGGQKQRLFFLTTHFMEEAERLCDRVAILDHGQIVALDTPANLIASLETGERIIFSGEVGDWSPDVLANLPQVMRVESQGNRITVHGWPNGSNGHAPLITEIVGALSAEGIRFSDLRTEHTNLEDVFLTLTGRQMRE